MNLLINTKYIKFLNILFKFLHLCIFFVINLLYYIIFNMVDYFNDICTCDRIMEELFSLVEEDRDIFFLYINPTNIVTLRDHIQMLFSILSGSLTNLYLMLCLFKNENDMFFEILQARHKHNKVRYMFTSLTKSSPLLWNIIYKSKFFTTVHYSLDIYQIYATTIREHLDTIKIFYNEFSTTLVKTINLYNSHCIEDCYEQNKAEQMVYILKNNTIKVNIRMMYYINNYQLNFYNKMINTLETFNIF